MDNVQWIKLKVGMFDGESFKKIKKAKIGGESFRDKLTAVWFELMDFAGKCNHSGYLINSREIPFQSISDIAVMIDRTPEELELCMNFFINEGMVEIIDDMYLLSNWMVYQNEAGLEKIREQTRLRVEKHRKKKALIEGKDEKECNVTGNVTTALQNRYPLILNSNSSSNSSNKKKEEKRGVGGKGEKKQPVSDETLLEIGKLPTVDVYGAQAVVDVIENSMGSNYVGIVWDRLKKDPAHNKQSLRSAAPIDYGSPEDFYK